MSTKAFADLTLDPIALDGRAARLERYSQAEVTQLIGHAKNDALLKAKHLTAIKEAPILPRKVEPSFKRE